MLCAFCPPTFLGDFYRIPEKLSESFANKMNRENFTFGCLQLLRGSGLLRSFAPFLHCALLRSIADLCLHSFAPICALLCSFAHFCVRPHLERPRLGTADTLSGALPRAPRFLRLSDPTEIPPPYRETGVAMPLSPCFLWYRRLSLLHPHPLLSVQNDLLQSKDRPSKGGIAEKACL